MSIEGFAEGVLVGFGAGAQGLGSGSMNLNHWQDAVWADGSWVQEAWGGVATSVSAGGSSRRRRRRRRFSEEDLVRQSIVNARQISQAPKEAMAVALRGLEVPAKTDVAMANTAEIARLIGSAQRKKEQEEEDLMMILSEIS